MNELEKRLQDAKRVQELHNRKEAEIAALEKRIEAIDQSLREARELIQRYLDGAGTASVDELWASISRSDSKRSIDTELSGLIATLAEEGDGMPLDELQRECDGVDLDRLAAHEEAIVDELAGTRERLLVARDVQNSTSAALDAIGGDDRAAKAAAGRQAALAEMEEIAEQYVRVRSAAILLQWAIDRYRREKQAPLLQKAGRLFGTLTSGSFQDLGLEFDDRDHAALTGQRPDGSTVAVGGMSTGTVDQLCFALRVASVEDYLERAAALPFVADDLFVNFDDERAMAGFEVLSELARKTQVLFFTHHEHLVNIARKSLGPALSVMSVAPDCP